MSYKCPECGCTEPRERFEVNVPNHLLKGTLDPTIQATVLGTMCPYCENEKWNYVKFSKKAH
jgi:predicted nucleic-acid-binding Zn-ribbon protein